MKTEEAFLTKGIVPTLELMEHMSRWWIEVGIGVPPLPEGDLMSEGSSGVHVGLEEVPWLLVGGLTIGKIFKKRSPNR